MKSQMRNFKSYYDEYKEFYEGVFELARMENKFSMQEPTLEEAKNYNKLYGETLLQCPTGTNIEDLIGLAVVGELSKKIQH